MTQDDSIYLSLAEALHWAVFRGQREGLRWIDFRDQEGSVNLKRDLKRVADYERVEEDLHKNIQSGQLKIFGRPSEYIPHEEIPVLELEDSFFDPLSNTVWRTADPFQPDVKRWIEVRLYRCDVLKVWPDSGTSVGTPQKGRPAIYANQATLIEALLSNLLKKNGAGWFKQQTIGSLEKEIREKALNTLNKGPDSLPKSTRMQEIINDWLKQKSLSIKRRRKI